MKPRIAIHLFGRLSVRSDDRDLLLHTSAKAREIFGYLAVHRRGAIPRERLAGLISNERSTVRCRKALRHAIWQLRGDLDQGGSISERILTLDEEWAQLVLDEGVSLDVQEFEIAAQDPARYVSAVELYREELLEGWDQAWCLEERERLRQIYLETLDSLMADCLAHRDVKAGVAYAMLALRNDPTREGTHRALMRFFALSGDRKSALSQFARCAEILRQELRIEPDQETRALEREIRAGHVTYLGGSPGLSLVPRPRR